MGNDKFNLWKPLVPEGVEGTWAPVEVVNDAGEIVKQAWYFNEPTILGSECCSVPRSSGSGIGAPTNTSSNGPSGPITKPRPAAAASLPAASNCSRLFHRPGHDLLGLGLSRRRASSTGTAASISARARGRTIARRPSSKRQGLSADGEKRPPHRRARHRRGRAALGPDEFAGRCVQRLLDTLHDGSLHQIPSQRHRAPNW